MTRIDLAGHWDYLFDPEDAGLENEWFNQRFATNAFRLPGTVATNQVGEKLDATLADDLNKQSVQSFRESYSYRGVMWLQKEVVLPSKFSGHSLTLYLERTLGSTHIWADDSFIGSHYSLSTAHDYQIPAANKERMTITIRLDNRNTYHLGELSSGYSEHTQGFWSGIVGEIALYKETLLDKNVSAYFDFAQQKIIGTCPKVSGLQPLIRLVDQANQEVKATYSVTEGDKDTYEFAITCQKDLIWNEFTSDYYQVVVSYDQTELKKVVAIVKPESNQHYISLSGKNVFLRGTLDCAIFPKTGHPPMEEAEWERVFQKLKAFGINHVRYHCWCPPEAAFAAADRLGMYLMVEGPFWLDDWFNNSVGDYPEHYELIEKECLAIVKAYGHHPSFLLFSVGNELHGDFNFLAKVLNHESFTQNQILTTVTANTTNYKRDFYEGADDFFIGVQYQEKGLRGNRFLDKMVVGTTLNYEEGVAEIPVPVITHEIGQYASYPDLTEIEKLDGPMVPVNLMAIKNDLIKKNMEDEQHDFTHYSGKLALDLYKAEVEAAVRTPSLSGFQLLGIQDYPGQDTAMIGMLDSRWEEKGFCTSEEFRRFCDVVIPIVEMEKHIFTTKDFLTYSLGVRNSLFEDIPSLKATVSLKMAGRVLYQEDFTGKSTQGTYQTIGQSEIDLSTLEISSLKGRALEVVAKIEVEGATYQNQWDIWLFPSVENEKPQSLIYDNWFSPEVISGLKRGENCLVSIDIRRSDFVELGQYFPVFWSPVFFESRASCGILIDKKHPIFQSFPTESYTTLQWKKLLENSVTFPLLDYKGITQSIPNFYNNEQRSHMAEFAVGSGKLILTGFDFDRGASIEEQYFKQSVCDYMNSKYFAPSNHVSMEELMQAYPFQELEQSDHEKDLAFRKEAWADNEQSDKMSAAKANDANPLTYWTTAAQTDGHWWCLDLGKVQRIKKLVIETLNPEHTTFGLLVSDDGQNWKTVTHNSEPQEKHHISVSEECRFIRLNMMHPINIAAGLRNVQVF